VAVAAGRRVVGLLLSSQFSRRGVSDVVSHLRIIEANPVDEDRREDGNDAHLLTLIARGDTQALALLYETHGPAAQRLAYRVLGDRAIAEDVTREAFISLGLDEGRESPEGEGVREWVLTKVRARAVDELFARSRLPGPHGPDDEFADGAPLPGA